LYADELRAVHFDIDSWKTRMLTDAWQRLGLSRLPLDIIECPDRRITRSTLDLVAETTADGDTEVSVLMPRREYTKFWHRLLHDRSSDKIGAALASLPHCNVTVVPYHLGDVDQLSHRRGNGHGEPSAGLGEPSTNGNHHTNGDSVLRLDDIIGLPADRVAIVNARVRERTRIAGRVQRLRVQPWGSSPSLECRITDPSGSITIVFLGRREIGGLRVGSVLTAEGVVSDSHGQLVIINPMFELLSVPPEPQAPGQH
jgi:hypothetical protein